jgi:hypothetical protein
VSIEIAISLFSFALSGIALYISRRSFWIQALNSLVDRFFTPEILDAERELRGWRHRSKEEFAKEWAGHRAQLAEGKLRGTNFADLDRGRRLLKSWF